MTDTIGDEEWPSPPFKEITPGDERWKRMFEPDSDAVDQMAEDFSEAMGKDLVPFMKELKEHMPEYSSMDATRSVGGSRVNIFGHIKVHSSLHRYADNAGDLDPQAVARALVITAIETLVRNLRAMG